MSVVNRERDVRPRPPLLGTGGNLGDTIFWLVCQGSAFSFIVLVVLLFGFIFAEAWLAIEKLGIGFLFRTQWNPPSDLGCLPFVFGTLWTSVMAMLVAVPLGVATATFLAEIAPPFTRAVGSFLIELLAAIPSVVYGFWAIKFLGPLTRSLFLALGAPETIDGNSLFTAGLVLAIMILPFITAIAFDVCRAVPRSQREGSLALGATRWQTIWNVVLPYARPGIVGGCFLALGRALGETMAVIMVIGNSPQIDFAPYAHGSTIPSKIALGLNELGGVERSALVELGAILLLVTVIVNCVARLLIWRMGKAKKSSLKAQAAQDFFWQYIAGNLALVGAAALAVRVIAAATALSLWIEIALVLLIAAGLRLGLEAMKRRGKRAHASAVWTNRLMTGLLSGCLFITCGPLFLILGFIALNGVAALDFSFFVHTPREEPRGLAHAIFGSAILVAMATAIAVPIGLLAAIFLSENPNSKLTKSVRFVGEILGGVPSIVVGVFGYALLVAPGGIFDRQGGFSAWAGAVSLGVMMAPIVLRASEEALKLVPQTLRHASYALGAAQWQTVLRVAVPAALPAIITGICLAIARIAGETAPLLLTCNQSSFWPRSLNDQFPYLTYYIYYYANSSVEDDKRLAWAAAFVLLAVVMSVNVGIRFLTGKRVVLASRAD
jgi:phosphate transport system permease protein